MCLQLRHQQLLLVGLVVGRFEPKAPLGAALAFVGAILCTMGRGRLRCSAVFAAIFLSVLSTLPALAGDWTWEARRARARTIKDEKMAPLEAAIPTLSPSQESWLRKEYDNAPVDSAAAIMRRLKVEETTEYRLRVAREWTEAQLNLASELASGVRDPRREAFLWTALAHNLLDRDALSAMTSLADDGLFAHELLNLSYIRSATDVLDPQHARSSPDKPDAQRILAFNEFLARELLREFVIPYLASTGTEEDGAP